MLNIKALRQTGGLVRTTQSAEHRAALVVLVPDGYTENPSTWKSARRSTRT